MPSQRIEYLDALRGFTMLLVVYSHVLSFSFRYEAGFSFNDVFMTFRMPLFFFLSGFLMYKKDRFRTGRNVTAYMKKKVMAQLVPTLIFTLVYALVFGVSYKALWFEKAKCGYWFTVTLFFFFMIYSSGDCLISKLIKGKVKILIGSFVAIGIYVFSKYSLSTTCPWFGSTLSGLFGYANFQFFLFFFFGALIRAEFNKFEHLLGQVWFITFILTVCIILQLLLHVPQCKTMIIENGNYSAYSLIKTISGFFGIITVFAYFRQNRGVLRNPIGRFFTYVGQRTLDIYLIHLFLIHTDLSFIGHFLTQYHSPVTELILGLTVSLIIISLCLVISRIIRCSDTLSKFLFGKVIK